MRVADYSVLDEALTALAPYGPQLANGNFNHAPMVAEALCSLGRPDAVQPWLEWYRERLLPKPSCTGRIDRADWRQHFGRRDSFAEWRAFFAEELQQAPWRTVLDRWIGRLAPGFSAAATHGAIRVAHAVRGLKHGETGPRRSELAEALASWAASYAELPTTQPNGGAALAPREAIARVAMVPPDMRRGSGGGITALLRVLDEVPEFAAAIGLIEVGGDLTRLVEQLTELFAGLYLANARDGLSTIVFIHGVTSAAAFGLIAPQIGEATARRAAPYAWQAGCALYSRFATLPAAEADIAAEREDADRLAELAVEHGDEHVIKFTEACLRQHALHPAPIYLAAARHVIGAVRRR
jgi:hypothetical protein